MDKPAGHQPSDLVELLARMAQEHKDATCQALYVMAARGEPILDVCYLAIQHLSAEKASYLRHVIVQANFQLPHVILVEKGSLNLDGPGKEIRDG